MNIRKLLPILLCFAVAPALSAPAGWAQSRVKSPALDLKRLQKLLESGDEAQVLAALAEIEAAKDPKAAPLVEALLTRGTNRKALLAAIEVAGKLAEPSSSPALAVYVQHRSPELRRAAASALINTKGSSAVAALRHALRSNDAQLRGIAASGLGALGAREAVADLFAVLPREVPEAASSIGALCSPSECEKFVSFIGKIPFDVMQSGLEPILLRPQRDIADDFKLTLIERVRKLQTASATKLLTTALARFPEDGSPNVKAALQAAVSSRANAGGKK